MKNNETISTISTSQHQIIRDILLLHNEGNLELDLDITYSEGLFYGVHSYTDTDGTRYLINIPQPKHKCDVAPMSDDIIKIEPWGKLPFQDGTMNSIMFDPPFIISPRTAPSVISNDKSNNKIFRRFSGYYPVNELLDSYLHWMEECHRLLKDDGLLIFKNQPCVTGGKQLNTHHYIWLMAETLGFDTIDEFVLISKQRLIGKVKKQQHARKFHSYFYVLRKSTSKKTKYLSFLSDSQINSMSENFIKNNIGKDNGTKNDYRNDIKPQTHVLYKG